MGPPKVMGRAWQQLLLLLLLLLLLRLRLLLQVAGGCHWWGELAAACLR